MFLKNSKIYNTQGFTFLELIIVITGLFLFSVIVIISRNYFYTQVIDSKRLSDVRQMSTILESQNIITPFEPLTGCVLKYSLVSLCDGPEKVASFKNYQDPKLGASQPCQGGTFGSVSKESCGYSITSSSGQDIIKTSDYEICFYLERGYGALKRGLYNTKNGGIIESGCD